MIKISNSEKRAANPTYQLYFLPLLRLRAAPIPNSHSLEIGEKKTSPSRLVKASINNWRMRAAPDTARMTSNFLEDRAISKNRNGARR